MTVRRYSSTDPSAPVFNGAAGSLIALLDACLVNGYGSKAASGWTKTAIATNVAAYKQPSGSNGMFIRVDDTTTLTSRIVGCETQASYVDGASNIFPTAVQLAGGAYITKSSDTSTARAWVLVCNGKSFYIIINQAGAVDWSTAFVGGFSQIDSYYAGDAYNNLLISGTAAAVSQYLGNVLSGNAITSSANGHWSARAYHQTGSSIIAHKLADTAKMGNSLTVMGASTSVLQFPSPVDGSVYVSPVWVGDGPTALIRGTLPGIWCPQHARPLAPMDVWTPSSGPLLGKTFEAWPVGTTGQLFVETSDTW